MQRRFLSLAARTAVACALFGAMGCATILSGTSTPVNVNSVPMGANVEIKRNDGIVVKQGQTPMKVKLGKGKEYTVTISLDGYHTQNVPVLKGGIETEAFCNLGSLPFWAIDYVTGAMFKLEPGSIHVSLKEVTAQDGSDSAIYALLTIVDAEGTRRHTAVEMTPAATN